MASMVVAVVVVGCSSVSIRVSLLVAIIIAGITIRIILNFVFLVASASLAAQFARNGTSTGIEIATLVATFLISNIQA